jgi:hypothetical protein
MKARHIQLFVTGLMGLLMLLPINVWAGAGGEGSADCVLKKSDIEPPGTKLTGTLAVSADVNAGEADVILRLEGRGKVQFFRADYFSSSFTAPTLLAAQTRLCEILNIPGLADSIIGAFNLHGTSLVTTSKGIRDTQVIPSVDCNVDRKAPECKVPGLQFESDPDAYLNPGNPARAIVISDIVLFVQ